MRILWISNDPRTLNCGQSRVTREILARFHQAGIEVHCAAFGHGATKLQVPYPIHLYQGEKSAYPKHLIEKVQPDYIVLSHDCWLFYWLEQCKLDFPHIKLIGYYTIDGGPIHGSWIKTMAPLDLLCTPTQFGKQEIYARYPEKHVAVIPYGVDHSTFNLKISKEEAKRTTDVRTKEIARDCVITENKCIFCYVGQNQMRKNVAAILAGFELADIPDSHLLLITHCYTQQQGGWSGMGDYDLIDLIGTFEHRERITVAIEPADDTTVAAMYRCADYFVLPSQGEAPGLPLIESMACGCIPIFTDYAGAKEVAGAGYPLTYTMFRGQFNVNRAMVAPETVADAMRSAYCDWKAGKNPERIPGVQHAAQQYNWDKTAHLWLHYLAGLQEGRTLVDTELTNCL